MKTWFVALLALILAGCASIDTDVDYNTDANFSDYRSWAWLPVSAEQGAPYQQDGLNDQRIRRAIASELLGKGLIETSADNADLLVNYVTSVETKIDVDTFYSSFGYHPYYYRNPFLYGGVSTETRVREYQQGTLMVDLIDPTDRNLLWRGSASGTVKQRQTPAERTEAVKQAVNAILAQYPPAP
ncbi:DUF4136 domain-containing protein [Ferrimonas senticii]|uniref:DUF4136 domain-containing protein n=1 Tax=Ferrimonas senticii TaxID=394566 RepID=UPI0004117BB5|nr:DUF4136 domain-containing protein [Ferrimonas senticii]